jgi:glycosyltransferase involved in cell wall biosynthesis
MKKNIKISVVTATFNSADTLQDCLMSFALQNYFNKEHILIDGSSTDSTINIINANLSSISSFLSEDDKGIYDALNKGISLSSGDVIGFLHSDDFFFSNDVLTLVSEVFQDETVCAVYGDLNYVNQHDLNKIIRKWRSNHFSKISLFFGWMPPHPTLFVRREWYFKINGFDQSYSISADYDTVLKFFFNPDFKSVYLPKVLVTMRLGGESNKSIKSILKKTKEDYNILKNFGFNLLFSIFIVVFKNLRKITQFL